MKYFIKRQHNHQVDIRVLEEFFIGRITDVITSVGRIIVLKYVHATEAKKLNQKT